MMRIVTDTPSYSQPRPPRTGAADVVATLTGIRKSQPVALEQVFLIQSAAAVDSLCPVPGLGQFAGAVLLPDGVSMPRPSSWLMIASSCGQPPASLLARSMAVLSMYSAT